MTNLWREWGHMAFLNWDIKILCKSSMTDFSISHEIRGEFVKDRVTWRICERPSYLENLWKTEFRGEPVKDRVSWRTCERPSYLESDSAQGRSILRRQWGPHLKLKYASARKLDIENNYCLLLLWLAMQIQHERRCWARWCLTKPTTAWYLTASKSLRRRKSANIRMYLL